MNQYGVLPAIGYPFNAYDENGSLVELVFEAGAGYLVRYRWTDNQAEANWSGAMPENLKFWSPPVPLPAEAGDRHFDYPQEFQDVLLPDPVGWYDGTARWGGWDDPQWFDYPQDEGQRYVYSNEASGEYTEAYRRTNYNPSNPYPDWRTDNEAAAAILVLYGGYGPKGYPPIYGTFWRKLLWYTEPYLGVEDTGYQWSATDPQPEYLSWNTTGYYRRAVPVWPCREGLRIVRPGGAPMVFKSAESLQAWAQLLLTRNEQDQARAWGMASADRKKMAAKKINDLNDYAARYPLTKQYVDMRIEQWAVMLLD